jgi:cell fate regulator YaaT (PSP1 superfamily)
MGCGTCSSGGCSTGGCGSRGSCATGGCNKLNVFDWLADMRDASPEQEYPYMEVRFKGGRKEFAHNDKQISFYTGDAVIIESAGLADLGFVSLQGELVKLQMKKKSFTEIENLPKVIRKATPEDLTKYESAKSKEMPILYRSREIANELGLQMKLSEVEVQYESKKAIFYYTAEDRVDFRELIKKFASEFKIRVEMKQISLRQEAGMLGGIGVCGRELCCSTWLTDFKSVNTSAARYQNLSLNPQKLSGQCGRLKCCLNYELDTYMDALKDIPEVNEPLLTQKGSATLQKTDIFRKLMWFSFNGESDWHKLTIEDVLKIQALNKKGIKPNTLDPNDLTDKEGVKIPINKNSELEKFDEKLKSKHRNHNQRQRDHKR